MVFASTEFSFASTSIDLKKAFQATSTFKTLPPLKTKHIEKYASTSRRTPTETLRTFRTEVQSCGTAKFRGLIHASSSLLICHGQFLIYWATSFLLQAIRAWTNSIIVGSFSKVANFSIRVSVGLSPLLYSVSIKSISLGSTCKASPTLRHVVSSRFSL